MSSSKVILIHAVDTEGPLYESASETVARLNRIVGLNLPETSATLDKIKSGTAEFGQLEDTVKKILDYSYFLNDWSQVKSMLDRITSPEFRAACSDSSGNPWIFNWFIMDHVGYEVNPRRRDIGFHNIFDFYREYLGEQRHNRDEIGFHFHPDHFYAHAHMCGSTYSTSRYLYEILARRVIDRNWFPNGFRAGFHTERQDSHMFLEQWIPHDFSNQSFREDESEKLQKDLSSHRFGDWSRAPAEWGFYHPHHDDYQARGSCRRKIFRCLNIGTRIRCIDEAEVEKAFAQAKETKGEVVVGVTNHDFRDMTDDLLWLKRTFDKYSAAADIPWVTGGISSTFESTPETALQRNISFDGDDGFKKLVVEYAEPIFGPQPFLAIKLKNEIYHHVNLDTIVPFKKFSFVFDLNTVAIQRVESIALATNDRFGRTYVDRVLN